MKNVSLNLGGELAPGDVIGVSYNNCIVFGWYVESGQYGSLKFLGMGTPAYTKSLYDEYVAGNRTGEFWHKRFAKGLQFRNFRKDFIVSYSHNNNRAFKVSNPEEFFKGSVNEKAYLENKEILVQTNFPAK
jgi:hypothetical protein